MAVLTPARREELHRRGLLLEWFTVAWNVVEAFVAIGVVVAAERLEEVAEAARAREEKESRLRPRLRAGELTYDLLGLRAKEGDGRFR